MTVYVDNVFIPARVGRINAKWCHMTADTREELDNMADRISLRRSWIQYPGTWKEHYDVTESRRAAAVTAGAVEVDAFEHTRTFMRDRRERLRAEEVQP